VRMLWLQELSNDEIINRMTTTHTVMEN